MLGPRTTRGAPAHDLTLPKHSQCKFDFQDVIALPMILVPPREGTDDLGTSPFYGQHSDEQYVLIQDGEHVEDPQEGLTKRHGRLSLSSRPDVFRPSQALPEVRKDVAGTSPATTPRNVLEPALTMFLDIRRGQPSACRGGRDCTLNCND